MKRIVAFVLSVILVSGCLILVYGNYNLDKTVSNKIAESTTVIEVKKLSLLGANYPTEYQK